jgi:hypothetical protein
MIVQNVTTDADPRAAITFTLAKTDLARAKPWVETVAKGIGAREVRYDEDVVKVSIVGFGMRSHAGIAAKMFRILANEGINIQAIARDPRELPGRSEVHRARGASAPRRVRSQQGLSASQRSRRGTHECVEPAHS